MARSEVFDSFVDELRAGAPGLEVTQMFGKPCARLGGEKPVLSFMDGCMVFKLGATRVQAILAEHPEASPFDPSGKGRPFKDWVRVPETDGLDLKELGFEALGVK